MLSLLFPLYHFDRRKAIELWPREVYRPYELFPISRSYNMGPVIHICGPALPLTLLYRNFGKNCFHMYYIPTGSHHNNSQPNPHSSTKILSPPSLLLNMERCPSAMISNNNNDPNPMHTTTPSVHVPPSSNNDYNKRSSDQKERYTMPVPPLLPPHVPQQKGGQWEGTQGYPLLEEHYIPIQPKSRHLRRWTNFNYQQLQLYLLEQSIREQCIISQHRQQKGDISSTEHISSQSMVHTPQRPLSPPPTPPPKPPRRTVYMDGVFDLFHIGHVHAIQQCAELGDTVIIGVVGDTDATLYKRAPIISQHDRIAVVESMKQVHQVICPCPLIVTLDFIQQYQIDLVVHGFANPNDVQKQVEFFRVPQEMNMFQQIDYYDKLSTTDIINKILLEQSTNKTASKSHNEHHMIPISNGNSSNTNKDNDSATPSIASNRFGTVLAAATSNSYRIPYDPFPFPLRNIIEPHIQKARTKQNLAIEQVCEDSNLTKKDVLEMVLHSSPLATEGIFHVDTQRYPLRETLLQCGGFPSNFDLTQLHDQYDNKDDLLYALTCNFSVFQCIYDEFVRHVCIPRMVDHNNKIVTSSNPDASKELCYYYQAFPCIRIVQPNEFSIGPHSDITYGHHIGCINIYVPLTCIDGTAALFLESRYGSEDWHPIVGNYGMVKHFPGATCLHWTTNNTSSYTRVSLDFRLISGTIYDTFTNSGSGFRDGFYNCCQFRQETGTWERLNAEMISPDKRTGFPWTVKDWDAYRRKKQEEI